MIFNSLSKDLSVLVRDGGLAGSPGQPAVPEYTIQRFTGYQPDYKVVTITGDDGKKLTYYIGTGAPIAQYQTITVPSQPEMLPVAPRPASTVVSMNLGWTAGARSVTMIREKKSGTVQFSVPKDSIGVVVGLGPRPSRSYGFQEIKYGIYCGQGVFAVMENGTEKGARAPYVEGDIFSVQRSGNVVRYYRNFEMFRSVRVKDDSELYMISSMYSGGDTVDDASMTEAGTAAPVDVYSTTNYGEADVSFEPLVSRSGIGSSAVITWFEPLTTDMTVRTNYGANVRFEPLISRSSNFRNNRADVEFEPLTVAASGGWFIPSINSVVQVLPFLTTGSTGMTGQVGSADVAFEPLVTMSSNKPYADGRTKFRPLTTFSTYVQPLDGIAQMTMGMFSLYAAMNEGSLNGVKMTLAKPTLRAFTAFVAKAKAPKFGFAANMNTDRIMKAKLSAPRFKLQATMRVGSVSGAQMTMPGEFSLRAFGAAHATATLLNKFTLNAQITSGSVMRAMLTMPGFTLDAGASLDATMRAVLTMPMLRPVASMRAELELPRRFRLNAVMRAVVAVTYEAYAVNLLTPTDPAPGDLAVPAVTHYTGMPFFQIVRFGDDYYGVASSGLFKLGGDTDDGEPIAWGFDTGMSDFGTKQYKRAVSMYVGGRIDTQASASLHVGEATPVKYSYAAVRGRDAENHRVMFGKGNKSRYYAFGLEDTTGKFMEVDSLDLEITTLDRAQ